MANSALKTDTPVLRWSTVRVLIDLRCFGLHCFVLTDHLLDVLAYRACAFPNRVEIPLHQRNHFLHLLARVVNLDFSVSRCDSEW